MFDTVVANIALVLLFILVGGFFAAAEMAMVSLRESQVRKLSHLGRRGERVAKLVEPPVEPPLASPPLPGVDEPLEQRQAATRTSAAKSASRPACFRIRPA